MRQRWPQIRQTVPLQSGHSQRRASVQWAQFVRLQRRQMYPNRYGQMTSVRQMGRLYALNRRRARALWVMSAHFRTKNNNYYFLKIFKFVKSNKLHRYWRVSGARTVAFNLRQTSWITSLSNSLIGLIRCKGALIHSHSTSNCSQTLTFLCLRSLRAIECEHKEWQKSDFQYCEWRINGTQRNIARHHRETKGNYKVRTHRETEEKEWLICACEIESD